MSKRAHCKCTVEFSQVVSWSERGPKNPKENFFIPNLVNFLIKISLIGGMSCCRISPMSPSYSMHIWTYINKHTGAGRCTLGLELIQSVEDQTINTCRVYYTKLAKISIHREMFLPRYTNWIDLCLFVPISPQSQNSELQEHRYQL